MIEQVVLERVLGAGVRTGGEFAEVFVEDKQNGSATLDDGRVEQLSSGRDRWAGIRVVVGETTGFAHTSDLSESGLRAAAEAAAAAASQGGGGTRTVALTRTPTSPNSSPGWAISPAAGTSATRGSHGWCSSSMATRRPRSRSSRRCAS